MIFGGVEAGGPDLGGGSRSRRDNAGSQMGQGVGARSARWQGGRTWQGQEGQMAVTGSGGAGGPDGREPGGAGQWGKKG